ncbi:MAG: hypothetical protein ABIH03_12955 [Pseudomonadota bacterium]
MMKIDLSDLKAVERSLPFDLQIASREKCVIHALIAEIERLRAELLYVQSERDRLQGEVDYFTARLYHQETADGERQCPYYTSKGGDVK